jgi:hypothetical protein
MLQILTELKLLNQAIRAVARDVREIRTATEKQASELWQQKSSEFYRPNRLD